MHINFMKKDTTLYAKIIGELDHHYAIDIREQIDGRVVSENIKTLIVDLSSLTFMDSSGIGVLVGRYKLMNRLGGKIYIISGNKNVDRLVAMSGINRLIEVVSSVNEIEE